jgi:1,4-alpha-glucan branching enzyme
MIHKRHSVNPGKVVVVFEIPGTIWADRINLVGDFNNWDRESVPLRQDRQGNWLVEMELDVGCEYCFRYLFDSAYWVYDWQADKSMTNSGSGYDSIVLAELPPAI